MTLNSRIRFAFAAALSGLVFAAPAFAQRAADRASSRTDTTRAATEGRINRLDQGEQTVVREEVVTVPVVKRVPTATTGPEGKTSPGASAVAASGPRTKTVIVHERVTVRRVETVKRAPRINPY